MTFSNHPTYPHLLLYLHNNPFLLIKPTSTQPPLTLKIQINNQPLEAYYVKNINIFYSKKLASLLQLLGVAGNLSLGDQWLLLYEIPLLKEKATERLNVESSAYGEDVVVKGKKNYPSTVSNMFRFQGDNFYFLSSSQHSLPDFALVRSARDTVYGVTYNVKDVTLCLPFYEILFEKPSRISVNENLRPVLQGTCYVFFLNSYCTGIMVNGNTVLSARHVIPF